MYLKLLKESEEMNTLYNVGETVYIRCKVDAIEISEKRTAYALSHDGCGRLFVGGYIEETELQSENSDFKEGKDE